MLCTHVQFTCKWSDVVKQKITGIFVSTNFYETRFKSLVFQLSNLKNCLAIECPYTGAGDGEIKLFFDR